MFLGININKLSEFYHSLLQSGEALPKAPVSENTMCLVSDIF